MKTQPESSVSILMVEDNPADVVLFKEACSASNASADVLVVSDGVEALQFLRRENPFEQAQRPDVVVLDLNLPLMDGKEVLEAMNSDSAINTIPVAILTTSTSEAHLCKLYLNGRCIYFTKTDDFTRLQSIVKKIVAHARKTAID